MCQMITFSIHFRNKGVDFDQKNQLLVAAQKKSYPWGDVDKASGWKLHADRKAICSINHFLRFESEESKSAQNQFHSRGKRNEVERHESIKLLPAFIKREAWKDFVSDLETT